MDTNILRADFLLQSPAFKKLIDFTNKTGSSIILPQIVSEELTSLYAAELKAGINRCAKEIDFINVMLMNEKIASTLEIDVATMSKDYIKRTKRHLGIGCQQEPKYQEHYLNEIVNRAINRIKPISEKGEEFRDALLWLTIVDFLKDHRYCDSVFISNNKKDFANDTGTDLHDDLKEDLTRSNLKLTYYNSLNSFINEIASNFEYLTKSWIEEHLDWCRLNSDAMRIVDSINCAFFFEYISRNISENYHLYNWEVKDAQFLKTVDYFLAGYSEKINYHSADLWLGGLATVSFFRNRGRNILRNVYFGMQISVNIIDKVICNYPEEYYEEETGLSFYYEKKRRKA